MRAIFYVRKMSYLKNLPAIFIDITALRCNADVLVVLMNLEKNNVITTNHTMP
jgi:hypothetical protein